MSEKPHKKPVVLPVLNPDIEEDWLESDEAVPHPEASADPETERQVLHSFAREAKPAKQCCEEMETQLGFSRTQPVVLHDGNHYWLPSPTGDPGVVPTLGAKIQYCPWCGKNLDRAAHAQRQQPGKSRPAKGHGHKPNPPGTKAKFRRR